MEKFRISFEAKSPIETSDNEVFFKKYKIILNKKENSVECFNILIDAENKEAAKEEARKIIEEFNNFYCYKKHSLMVEENVLKIENLTKNKIEVVKSLTFRWDISGKINFNKDEELKIYNKHKNIKNLDKLLSVFGSSFRVNDGELKFLCFYKIINEFGKIKHIQVDQWLKTEFGLINEERKRKDNRKAQNNTWPVNLRHAILYDENPIISDKQLKDMEKFAKKFIFDKYFS